MKFTNKERTQEWATALLESPLHPHHTPEKKRGRHLGSVATMWDQHLGSYLGKRALSLIPSLLVMHDLLHGTLEFGLCCLNLFDLLPQIAHESSVPKNIN